MYIYMYHPFTSHIQSSCVAIFAVVFFPDQLLSQESAKEKKSDAKAAKAEKAKDLTGGLYHPLVN